MWVRKNNKPKAKHTINLNGKLYDAASGQLLADLVMPDSTAVKFDQPSSLAATSDPSSELATQQSNKIVWAKPRQTGQPLKTHLTRSKTLDRRFVKPAAKQKVVRKVQLGQSPAVQAKNQDQTERLKRANAISRSQALSHFATEEAIVNKVTKPLVDTKQQSKKAISMVDVRRTAQATSQLPHANQNKASRLGPARNLHLTDIIHQAIADRNAAINQHMKRTEHSTSQPSTTKRWQLHWAHASAGLITFLLLGGYLAYLNLPSLSIKLAANRAGFAAHLPSTPSGYRINGPIAYKPGQVTINFHSNTDSRRFSLQQQPSQWDSVALLDNYVRQQDQDYRTYTDRGLTIYLYGKGQAAWIDEGKLYSLRGDSANLSSDQILNIAASL